MFKQKSKTPITVKRVSYAVFLAVAVMASFLVVVSRSNTALAATSSTINFQARLLTAAGSVVPDGQYNVEFKLYTALTSSGSSQGSCTGDAACVWAETRSSANTVRVVNGYLTVNLGSVTSFPTTINWDQQLWLGMNIGGTSVSPSWDGEMTPRLQLTAVPYAFRAGTLVGGTGANTTVLDTGTPSGNNTIHLPAASGTVCLQSATACGFALASGSGSYIQNGTAVQLANFNVQAATSGSVAGTLQANGTGDILDLVSSVGSTLVSFNSAGALTLSGTGTTNFATPQGSNIPTKINVPTYDPGAYGQIIALGVPSTAQATARVLSLIDARTGTHQPTLAVFNPVEGDAIGFSWNGSNSNANVQTIDYSGGGTSSGITVRSGNVGAGNGNSGSMYFQSGSIAGGTGAYSSGIVVLQSGNASGTNGSSGNVQIDVGTATGTLGSLQLGINNATNITMGHNTGTVSRNTINGITNTTNALLVNNSSMLDTYSVHTNTTTGTFQIGTNLIGNSSKGIAVDTGNVNMISASKYNSGAGGTINGLRVYFPTVAASPNNHVKVAIYADSAGAPGALLSSATAPSTVVTAATWTTVSLGQTVTLAANTNYWIAFNVDSGSTTYGYQNNSANTSAYVNMTYTANFPATFGTPSSYGNLSYTLYTPYITVTDPTQSKNGFTMDANNTLTLQPTWDADGVLSVLNAAGSSTFDVNTSANYVGMNQLIVASPNSTAAINASTNNAARQGAIINGATNQTAAIMILQAGATPTATADLMQLQDSSSNINAKFNNVGNQLTLGRIAASGTVTQGKIVLSDGTTSNFGATIQTTGTLSNNSIFQLNVASANGTYQICSTLSVCTGYAPVSGDANYIQNTTTVQAANMFIQASNTAFPTAVFEQASAGTADVIDVLKNDGTTKYLSVSSAGNFTVANGGSYSLGSTSSGSLTSNGSITITAGGGSTWSTSSGNLAIQGAGNLTLTSAGANTVSLGDQNATTISIGSGSNIARTFTIGTGGTSTAQAITMGSTGGTSTTTIQAGSGTAAGDLVLQTAAGGIIGIGTNAVTGKVINIGSVGGTVNASTINIATTNGNATQAVSIGNTGSANNSVLIQGGSSASAVQIQVASTGTIGIANNAVAQTVNIGNTTGATGVTLAAGSGNILMNSAAGTVMTVDTVNGRVGVGSVAPTRTFQESVNNTQIGTPMALFQQAGTGDSSLEFMNTNASVGTSIYIGQDSSNAGAYTIGSSISAGAGTSSVTFVQSSGNTTGSTSATSIPSTFSSNVAAGNLIVVAVSWDPAGSSTYSCSDSLGNTYANVTSVNDATNAQSLAVCYAANIVGGADTVTVTFGGSVGWRRMAIAEYHGASTAPLDVFNASVGAATTAPDGESSGSVTTTAPGDLVFGAFEDTGATNIAGPGTGFAQRYWLNSTDTIIEDRILPAAGSVAATATYSSASSRYDGIVVTFKRAVPAVTDTFSTPLMSVSQTGATTMQNMLDSTSSLNIQNSSGVSMLNVDTSNSEVAVFNSGNPALGTWQTSPNTLPAAVYGSGIVTANGYVYVVGGQTNSTTYSAAIYYAKINGDGSLGAWTTSSVSLPAALTRASVVYANGYIYAIGGWNGASLTTAYYSRVNSDGTLNTFQTTTALATARSNAGTAYANGYIYMVGGYTTTVQSSILYSKVNPDGTLGAWGTTTNALTTATYRPNVLVANGRLYVVGGQTTTAYTSGVTTTAYVPISAATGNTTAAFTATGALPVKDTLGTTVMANGYMYMLAGTLDGSTSSQSVFYGQVANGGAVTWNNSSLVKPVPSPRNDAMSVVINGYIYVIGGANGAPASSTATNTVYYASTPRLQLGGSLDLVGIQGTTLTDEGSQDNGSMGGSVTAGNGTFVGTLQVQGQATFQGALTVNGVAAFNDAVEYQRADGSRAFRFRTSGGALDFETAGTGMAGNLYFSGWTAPNFTGTQVNFFIGQQDQNRLYIGGNGGLNGANPMVLILDNRIDGSSADPAGVTGAMYYNSTSAKFRCYENGAWRDCSGGTLGYAAAGATQGSVTTTPTAINGESLTVTVPANHRIRISAQNRLFSSVAGDAIGTVIMEGTTQLQDCLYHAVVANQGDTLPCSVILTPTAGSHTYTMKFYREAGSGNVATNQSANAPAYMMVEDIGQ